MIAPRATTQSRSRWRLGSVSLMWSRTACSSGPPGSFGTWEATSLATASSSSIPAPIRIDSALSTSAKFGTNGQPILFCLLGFHPSKEVANGAVMGGLAPEVSGTKTASQATHNVAFGSARDCVAARLAVAPSLREASSWLGIHVARSLTEAVQTDPMARQYYGQPPLRQTLILPPGAQAPARKYLAWH